MSRSAKVVAEVVTMSVDGRSVSAVRRPASQTPVTREPVTLDGHRGECPPNEDSLIFSRATRPRRV
jgi:hypothetical protein